MVGRRHPHQVSRRRAFARGDRRPLRDVPPDGILAVGDRPTVIAAHAAAAFHRPGNPPAAAQASRNKLASRKAFREAGLLVPAFLSIPLNEAPGWAAAGLQYPLVIKRWRCPAVVASCVWTTSVASLPLSNGCATCCHLPTCAPSRTPRIRTSSSSRSCPARVRD